MTGRNGGFIFENNGRFVIVTHHPNKPKSWLIFPAIPNEHASADLSFELRVAEWLNKEKEGDELVLARIPINTIINSSQSVVDEQLLDWKYPVQILGVNRVVEHAGKDFQQLRQRLNNIDKSICKSRNIDINKDEEIIFEIARNWAQEFPYNCYSNDDLISPTIKLINLMKEQKLNLHGQIISYDGIDSAYSIWEEDGIVSNVYAMTANRNIPGLAELNIVIMCQILMLRNVKLANLGGSESEGLNRYKKKFAPIQSIQLKSCNYKLKP